MRKIEGFETEDGALFRTEREARQHEAFNKLRDQFNTNWCRNGIEDTNDLKDFLRKNAPEVLAYLNGEKNDDY